MSLIERGARILSAVMARTWNLTCVKHSTAIYAQKTGANQNDAAG
jgi:hypothetical protein